MVALSLILAIGLHCAIAARVDDDNDMGATDQQQKFKLPRKCTSSSWSGSDCCSCEKSSGSRLLFGKMRPTCPWQHGNTIEGKMCCALWATDCEPEDEVFKQGLEADCHVSSKRDCDANECSDVAGKLLAAKQRLRTPAPAPDSSISYVTDNSNSGRCSCACGKPVSHATKSHQCEALETGFFCKSKVRDCCTKLDDCKPEDPWPQAIAKLRSEHEASLREHQGVLQGAQKDMATLQDLSRTCREECKKSRQELCLADLRTVVEKGGLWGHDRTQQEVDQQEFYDRLQAAEDKSNAQWEQEQREWEQERKRKMQEKEAARNRERRENQLISLKNWFESAGNAISDALAGKECCRCQMIKGNTINIFGTTTFITDFCSAPDCGVYQAAMGGNACHSVDAGYCGSRYTACPGDLGYYGRGGD